MVGGAGLGRGVASHDVAFFAPGAAFVLATNTKLSLWLRRGSVRHLLRTWPTGQIYGHAWPKGSTVERGGGRKACHGRCSELPCPMVAYKLNLPKLQFNCNSLWGKEVELKRRNCLARSCCQEQCTLSTLSLSLSLSHSLSLLFLRLF